MIAGLSYGMSYISPVFDPLVLGIILGIIISNLLDIREDIEEGAEFTIKVALPVGISLYGFQLRFQNHTPAGEFIGLLYSFIGLYLITYILARLLKLNTNTSILLSTGMAICGASAIAVTSPAIEAKKEETSVAVLAVMTAGLLYTILYPALLAFMQLSPQEFGFLSGATLPMLGLVKVTAGQMGEEALTTALRLKYLRIASLVFMVTLAMVITGIKKRRIVIPWFMPLFILFVLITNTTDIPSGGLNILADISRFFLTVTLTAIGLNTTLDAVGETGLKPFTTTVVTLTIIGTAIIFVLY